MRSAHDLSHVKSVSAMALIFKGKHAGNIVANWGDSRMGSTCTVTVGAWAGPLKGDMSTGRASGGGYCKWSAAFSDAIQGRAGYNGTPELAGCGVSACVTYLESLGYKTASVIG